MLNFQQDIITQNVLYQTVLKQFKGKSVNEHQLKSLFMLTPNGLTSHFAALT